MPSQYPDKKVVILDLEVQQARSIVYDERFCRYLSPPLPDDKLSQDFFNGIKKFHDKGFTGAGIRVGIIDTGIMPEHPALSNRCVVLEGVLDPQDGIDRHGHGTVVALLILAIAPDVGLVSLKALNDGGEGTREKLLEAMRRAAKHGVKVLNISTGMEGDGPASDCRCDVCSEANRLVEKGICVCAALGNDASKSYHPASASGVMTTSVLGERGFPHYITERVGKRTPDITIPQFIVPTLGGPYDGATSMGTAYLSGLHVLLVHVILDPQLSAFDTCPDELEKMGHSKEFISGFYLDKGLLAYRKSQIPEAIKWYKLSLQVNSNNHSAYYNLGMAYVIAGDLEAARSEFLTVLERDHNFVDAHINLGHVCNLLGEDEKAVSEFQEVLKLRPSSSLAMKNLAFMLSKRGDDHGAEDLLRQAVMIDPNNAEIHYDLGRIFELKKKLGDALSHYEAAIRLSPDLGLPRQGCNRVIKELKGD